MSGKDKSFRFLALAVLKLFSYFQKGQNLITYFIIYIFLLELKVMTESVRNSQIANCDDESVEVRDHIKEGRSPNNKRRSV